MERDRVARQFAPGASKQEREEATMEVLRGQDAWNTHMGGEADDGAERCWDVVLVGYGELDAERAAAALALAFELDRETARRVVRLAPATVKTGVTEGVARHYRDALRQTGAHVELRPT